MQAEPQPAKLVRRDIRKSYEGKEISRAGMRYLVDLYYQAQDFRKAAGNQLKAAGRSAEPPGEISEDIFAQVQSIEKQIQMVLDEANQRSIVGRWAVSNIGVGPVISAGLLAHIDIEQCPTVGHIWRFAGLDPTQHWLGREKAEAELKAVLSKGHKLEAAILIMAGKIGCRSETLHRLATTKPDGTPLKLTATSLAKACAKRPWNARLKSLCWNLGECFVKTCNNPKAFYGVLWGERKLLEEERNEKGDFAEQARMILASKNFSKDTDARKWYEQGKLPPAHLHARAKRYAVKMFLSHWHWVAWESTTGEPPPKPYIIEHGGHRDILRPPNWPMREKKAA